MKRIQLNLAVLALVLVSTFTFAFKAPSASHRTFTMWQFTGTSADDPTDPSLYVGVTGPPSCPSGSQNICYIDAPADPSSPSEPQISAALAGRLANHDTS